MKRILVCEDEDVIRDFVVINLKRAGYDVVDVNCGEDALKVFEEENGNFDIALLDIMMPGISKGNALAHIQKELGVTREETAAFGDNGNDIPMLMQAEESFAVANAREETMQAAKYVIGDVTEGAVLKELERMQEELKKA